MIDAIRDLVGAGSCSDPEVILDMIERMGMKPPMAEFSNGDPGYGIRFYYKWESEVVEKT